MTTLPEHSEPNKVTIEQLLRLKRAERPSPEFWTRFEQDLRAKQLAAIIEKRPWWISLRLPQAGRMLACFQVPVGAAAVLALSFVVVREYRPAASVPGDDTSVEVAATVPMAPVHEQVARGVAVTTAKSAPLVVSSRVMSEADAAAPAASMSTGELMAMIPWAAPRSDSQSEAETSPVIGELTQVQFASAVNPGADHDFGGRVELDPVGVSAAVLVSDEGNAPVRVSPVSPREVRRNSILSTLVVADNSSEAEPTRMAQVREVIASSLDEDRLYDSVRRIGMGGDRLTLKF